MNKQRNFSEKNWRYCSLSWSCSLLNNSLNCGVILMEPVFIPGHDVELLRQYHRSSCFTGTWQKGASSNGISFLLSSFSIIFQFSTTVNSCVKLNLIPSNPEDVNSPGISLLVQTSAVNLNEVKFHQNQRQEESPTASVINKWNVLNYPNSLQFSQFHKEGVWCDLNASG